MKRLLILMTLILFGLIQLQSQTKRISGTITSITDGTPTSGATVQVKGTTVGTVADATGKYAIDIPTGSTLLVFSYVGMKTVEIPISDRSVIDVALEEEIKGLDEIVVTALGIKREKKALDYSTQTVKGEQINAASQQNITNALQGKVAGVTVMQSSGMPGSSSYITIRGAKSLSGNNQPLYVVDGAPIVSDAIFADATTTDRVQESDASSRAIDINPEDIESIEILKGPVASALYGLRASNGVVLITTKSGKVAKGDGTINFTTSYTSDHVSILPELQDKYAQGSGGVFLQGQSRSWGPLIDSLGTYTNVAGQTVTGKKYDNVTPLFRAGGTYTANLSFSKATDNSNYDASVGYTNQSGIIPSTGMERYTGKMSGDYKVHRKLMVGGSAIYSHMDVDKLASGSNLSNPLFTTYYAPRSFDLWGIPFEHADNPYVQYNYRAAMDNPRWSLKHNKFMEKNDRLIGNAHLEYKPIDFLTLRYQLSIDNITNQQKEFYELGSGNTGGRGDPPSGGQIREFLHAQREMNSNFTASFNKTFGPVGVDVVLGNEFYDTYIREMNDVGTGFTIGGYENMANATSQLPSENIYKKRVVGSFGSATMSYKSIFFLTGTARNDIVSSLAKGNRSFIYPSLGGSFVFSELMQKKSSFWTFGKFRVSWAEVGQTYDNINDFYPTQNIFTIGGSAIGGFLQDGIQFPFNGLNGFSHSYILRSENLKPQNTKTTEAGIDMRFFENRIGLDYTYFNANVVDQIFQVPVPGSTGYQFALRNAGKLRSIGHEIMLNLVPVKTNNFSWNIQVNFTKYTNKVISLAPGVTDIYLGGFTTPSIRALAGETYPSIFGIGYVRAQNGKIVVYDTGANQGLPMADPNAKKIGEVQPDFLVGLNNTFTYKNIRLTALLDWKQGGQMYGGNTRLGRMYGILKETEDRERLVVVDAMKGHYDADGNLVITGTNDIQIQKKQRYWDNVLNPIDDAHVFSTTYVRLREVSVEYLIPQRVFKNFFIKSATFSVFGRNLALWTKYPNFDPETSTTGATNGQGLEYVAFPQTRSMGAKLSVTF